MKISRVDQRLVFAMEPWEREFIANCFFCLRDDYQSPLNSLNPDELKYWKGKVAGTPEESKELETEQHFLEEIRLQWRSERGELVDRWLQELTSSEDPSTWSIPLSEGDLFLQVINDRRLLLASRHAVTESDMDRDRFQVADSPKFRALGEIDFLAYLQGLCIKALPID